MFRLIAIVVVSLVAAACSHAQMTFEHPGLGFSMSIPAGYKQIDEKTLDAFPISKPQGGDAAYLAAFSKSGKLTPPYILVEARIQPWSLSDAKPSTIQSRLNLTPLEDLIKSGQFDSRHRYKGDGLSPAAFDKSQYRILVQGITTGGDGKPVYLYSVNNLGADEMVRINCFAPVQDATKAEAEFEGITNSFGFEPGAAYDPPPERTRSSGRWGRRGGIGGGVGILIALVIWWFNRD